MARILLTMILAYWVGSLIILLLSLTWENKDLAFFLILGCILQMLPLYFLLRGNLSASNSITVGIYILFATLFATFGQGIHDYVLMAYPASIMFSGLTARRRGLIISTLLILAALAWLVFGEANGWYVIYEIQVPDWADLITTWILIVIASMAVYLLVSNLQEGLAQAKRELDERLRIEEALVSSQKLSQSTIDALASHVCVIDENGIILTVNQAWRDFAELNPPFPSDYWLGANYLAICDNASGKDSEESKIFADGIRAVIRGELSQFMLEYPCHAPHEQRWFIGRVRHFAVGGILRLVVAHENITERKQIENKSRENEKKYRAIIESSPIPYAINDDSQNITLLNSAFTRTFGYTLDDIPTLADWWSKAYPDSEYRQWVVSTWQAHLEKAKRDSAGFEAMEVNIYCKDGSMRIVLTSAASLMDSFREAYLIVLYDITERKRVEEKLKESEFQNRAIINSVPDLLLRINRDGAILEFHSPDSSMLYAPPEEFLNKKIADILPAQIAEPGMDAIERALNTNQVSIFEYQLELGGNLRYFEDRIVPLTNDQVLSVIRDVTERKHNEALLKVRLKILEFSESHLHQELMQKALDEICQFTNSSIGFYHFVEPDQQTLSLQAWSTRTLEEFCKAEGEGRHYSIEQAGIWVDCVRQRKPVVHNDYASLPASQRKGLPLGHAEIIRELVVPIFRDECIEAILGVGNKPTDYTERDVESVSYIADVVWEIVKRKQAEELLEVSNEQLHLRVAEVEQLQVELLEQAIRDPLTGLYNRRYLNETLSREIKLTTRNKKPLSIIAMDVDHFKKINDAYGHQVGDLFLIEIAKLIKKYARGSDFICRSGGEEFLMVLPSATLSIAEKRAETLRKKCARITILHEGKPLKVTLSLGVATYPDHGQEAEEVMIKADKALYKSKRSGRNKVTSWIE